MKRKFFSFLLLIFIFCSSWAQTRVIPPSPISQEFAKYITHEVSLYNGTPEISIPLYTINLKGLSIPLNLSYHASGIKFAQDDGDVGVGWVINPGYRISRTVYGYADELTSMPLDISTTINNYEQEVSFGSSQAKLARDQFLSGFVPQGDFKVAGNLDGEFDQFVFSTPNNSGGFIISDRINKTVTTTEESNLNIDYKVGQSICSDINGIKGFQIIDDVGNKYAFGEYNTQSQCNTNTETAYFGKNTATAWGLSEIITPLGDQVKLNYVMGTPGKWSDHIRSFTVRETNPQNCNITTNTSEPGGVVSFDQGYSTFFSKEILTPNETIIFNYDPNLGSYKRLINIQVKSSTGDILKTIEFFYIQDSHHTFLDHVTIYDKTHIEMETYRFDYYSKNTTETFTSDHYGYYLKTDFPHSYFHQEFLDDPIMVSHQDGVYCGITNRNIGNYGYLDAVSREPNPTLAPDYFSLKKITYPTGGYTEYEYEPGRYFEVGMPNIRNAGMRIKKIKSSDLITQESLVRNFTYGNDDNGYGRAEFWTYYTESLFVKEMTEMDYSFYAGPGSAVYAQRIITYSTVMQGDIGTVFSQFGVVKYPCVTEYNSSSIPSKNGKTVYNFNVGFSFEVAPLMVSNTVPSAVYNGTPNYVRRYRLWDKPQLGQKVSYSQIGGVYIPLHKEAYEYEQTSSYFTGLKVVQSATQTPNSVLYIDSYSMVNSYFDYGKYTIEVGKNVLKRKIESDYLNGNTIVNEHNYEYSNLLPSKETIKRSSGDNYISYTTYPLDYATGTSFIDDMKNNRLIGYPIEKVDYLDNGSSQNILSGSINQYKTGGKGLIDSQWNIVNSSPLNLSSYKFSNRSTGILPTLGSPTSFLPDNKYAIKLTYDKYDTKGNILQYHKSDDINTAFLWSYNGLMPVIKGDNVTYDILNAAVIAAGATNLETLFSGLNNIATDAAQQTTWKNFNTALRSNATLANTQVTTYTYSPLIGMTSQTDPNGLTTYYDYDGFGRLKNVRDKDQNILKNNQYHYYNN